MTTLNYAGSGNPAENTNLSPLDRDNSGNKAFKSITKDARSLIAGMPTGEEQRKRLQGIGATMRGNMDLAADQAVQNISTRYGGINSPAAVMLATNARLGAEQMGGNAHARLMAEFGQGAEEAQVNAILQLLAQQLQLQQQNDTFSINNANVGINATNAAEARRVSNIQTPNPTLGPPPTNAYRMMLKHSTGV